MSKLFCGECKRIIDDISEWIEPHGEEMSGCKCGNGLMEIEPCRLCGEYPESEYDEGELYNGGTCEECYNDSISKYFMEYFNEEFDLDEQAEFYGCTRNGSYAFSSTKMFDIIKDYYNDYIESPYFDREKEAKIWKEYMINNGDIYHFVDWLVRKNKKEKEGK